MTEINNFLNGTGSDLNFENHNNEKKLCNLIGMNLESLLINNKHDREEYNKCISGYHTSTMIQTHTGAFIWIETQIIPLNDKILDAIAYITTKRGTIRSIITANKKQESYNVDSNFIDNDDNQNSNFNDSNLIFLKGYDKAKMFKEFSNEQITKWPNGIIRLSDNKNLITLSYLLESFFLLNEYNNNSMKKFNVYFCILLCLVIISFVIILYRVTK